MPLCCFTHPDIPQYSVMKNKYTLVNASVLCDSWYDLVIRKTETFTAHNPSQ